MIAVAAGLAALMAVTPLAPAADSDRQWHADRPSRGTHAATIRTAATVPPGWAEFAACVEDRESGGNPTVLNHEGSGAAGLFQFMPGWRHGLPYIVRERLIQFGMPRSQARKVRVYLSGLPIHRYPALYQRIGFAEVLDDGLWRHWNGHTCNGLRP